MLLEQAQAQAHYDVNIYPLSGPHGSHTQMSITLSSLNMDSSSSSWVRGKCIGKGAFGVVNVAVSKIDGRVFVVKSVDRRTGLPSQVEALENEIRILRRVRSPHVVAYLGDDVTCEDYATSSFQNLHLEYMPGGTVADLDPADVDERLVRRYAWCLVSALRDVHAHGFVHCDVKGRNVLIAGDCNVAKLADFGSAVGFAAEAVELPRGSPMWMAPEVVRRERQGPESDVWSLGCTVIEIVTGRPAWEDRGVDTLSRIAFSNEVPEFPSKLSGLGRDFLDKCLRREPSERWSCDQLLQHPFLLPYNRVLESSPRCVLDWVDSEFASESESDYDREQEEKILKFNSEEEENSVKSRISKLATVSRVNWEMQGWVVVRAIESNIESTPATETEEGVNWEISNVMEYSESEGANRKMRKFGGWRCRYGCGWEKLDRVRGILSIYSLCCKNFMSCYVLFLMYFNILCFSIISYVVYLLLHVTEKGKKIRNMKKLIESQNGRVKNKSNPALRSHGGTLGTGQ